MEPIIEFKGYQINKLFYGRIESDQSNPEEPKLQRKVSIGLSEDKKQGIVILNVIMTDVEEQRKIDIEVVGEFDIQKDLEEEKIEQVLSVNGVALVYPYIRSIISMVSSLDSDSAMVIPTINTKIYE